jgi:hypothetical protein
MNTELASYLETALWSSGDEFNEYSICDFSEESLEKARLDVESFESQSLELLSEDDSSQHIGHDFWLTRNGHGAGFWNGDYVNGDELTTLAESFGKADIYIDDNGKVYIG